LKLQGHYLLVIFYFTKYFLNRFENSKFRKKQNGKNKVIALNENIV